MSRLPYPDSLPLHAGDELSSRLVRLNVLLMCSHASTAMPGFLKLGTAILRDLGVSPRRRELLVLLVAHHTDCAYLRAQHIPIAQAAGATDRELDSLKRADETWPNEADAVLMAAGRQLLDRDTIEPATVEYLRRHFSNREIVEAILVIGFYRMVAGLTNGLDIDLDPQGATIAPLTGHEVAPTR